LLVSHAWRLLRLAAAHARRDAGAEYFFPVTETDKNGIDQTVDYLAMKSGISISYATRVWTSTPAGDQQYVSVFMGPPDVFGILFKPKQWGTILDPARANAHERVSKVSDRNAVLCVRPIDPDLLQIAKDAQVSQPVPDLLTLKANVPLNKARQAFQARDYQGAIAQAQSALAISRTWRRLIGASVSPTVAWANGTRPSPISSPRSKSTKTTVMQSPP
jgi:hypothetical protein